MSEPTSIETLSVRMESRWDQVMGFMAELSEQVATMRVHAPVPPPRAPPMAPEGSGPEIDQDYAINAGASATRREDPIRTSRRSSLLAELGPLMTPARMDSATPNARTTHPPPGNQLPVSMMVATEIKVKEEDKLSVITIRAVRRLQRMYRAHKKEHTHSKLTLGNFVSYKVLKEIRSNEHALGTDLSHALHCVEDLLQVGDDALTNALARYYRTFHVHTPGLAASRIYAEVDKIKWPREFHDEINDTWAINPEGFHLAMHSRALEWSNAVTESVQFIYHSATRDELRFNLPPVDYGSRHEPGLIQVVMKGLGELSESITALITYKRLMLVKDITEWEALMNDVFSSYASQSRVLAQQRAQATKPEKVEDLWKKAQTQDRRTDREQQPFVLPRPRTPGISFQDHRRGAVIHGFENEEEEQRDQGGVLAIAETPIKPQDDSSYYSTFDYDFEDETELFAFTSGPPKDTSGMPCFGDYAGSCKLGQACPYASSHGDKKMMQERSRRLIKQVFESQYGGRQMIAEVIAQEQAKLNNKPSPASQDFRQRDAHSAWLDNPMPLERRSFLRESPPHRTLAPRPQGSAQSPGPASTEGMRDRNDHGRGGGRLVTYSGRDNMGRAQYTNHLLLGLLTRKVFTWLCIQGHWSGVMRLRSQCNLFITLQPAMNFVSTFPRWITEADTSLD